MIALLCKNRCYRVANCTASFFAVHFCIFLQQRLFNVETSLSTCENCEAQYAQTTKITTERWWALWVARAQASGREKLRERRKIRRHTGRIFKCKSRHQYAAHTDIDTHRRHPPYRIRSPLLRPSPRTHSTTHCEPTNIERCILTKLSLDGAKFCGHAMPALELSPPFH